MTGEGQWRNIWRSSWPMLVTMVFSFFVGLTDVYIAGLIGPEVQAAVGFVSQIFFVTVILANAISTGTVALVSRATGAGDTGQVGAVARQSLLFGIVAAAGITSLGLLFHEQIIALAGFPPSIQGIADGFFLVYAWALGPNYFLIISNALFRARGEMTRVMTTMLSVSVLNIAGAFLLVFGIGQSGGMGYTGIAVATALACTAGMTMNIGFLSTGRWGKILAGAWKFSGRLLGRILSLSWPAALLQIAWSAGTIVLYAILGRLGAESVRALAAITNGLRIEAVIYLPAFALNMAAAVLVGQNLGAGRQRRAEKIGWKIALSGVAMVSVPSVIVFFSAEVLAGMLTGDGGVRAETARYLKVNMLSEPFMALSAILGGGLQGAGDTRGTMAVVAIAMWFVRLPLAYLLAFPAGLGASGVWWAMVASMAMQGLLMARRFHRGRWRESGGFH